MIDEKYGLHVSSNGDFITKEGVIYYKIIFLTCPIVTTNKRLMHQSGSNIFDGVHFQVSLTSEQVVALSAQIDKLIESLGLKGHKEAPEE
jgi:hypothetical protein